MAFEGNMDSGALRILGPSERQGTTFDDPPGYSKARWIMPLFEREAVLAELTELLRGRVGRIQIGGTSSGAHSGESFEIVLIVLGAIGAGIGAGFLHAIGKDIWDAVKQAMRGTARRKPQRALVEVAMEFEECDVILHAESRTPSEIPPMFDDGDAVLERLKAWFAEGNTLPPGAQTVEMRANSQGGQTSFVLYSYRRARLMMEEIRRATESDGSDATE
ncbi:MAG: hypothetical protein ABSF26_15685 [Thermoguttaceae bacterium]|jgi:hypothetical protein